MQPARGFLGSIRVRHFGPRPLTEDDSVESESTTLWNADVGYRFTAKVRLMLDVFNLFDAEVSDIDYFYTSRLTDEPDEGIDDVHTHPALPRSARVSLQVSF
jgi:outer membrane receptor protein involved in Fe transport